MLCFVGGTFQSFPSPKGRLPGSDASVWALTLPGQRLFLERCPGWHLGEVPFRVRLSDGTVIGTIAYRNLDRRRRSAELGIELDPPYRAQGYGPEAILTLLRYLFDCLGLERVWLRVFPENLRAIRCYRKCGFRDAGEGRAYLFFPCRVMDLDRERYYGQVMKGC